MLFVRDSDILFFFLRILEIRDPVIFEVKIFAQIVQDLYEKLLNLLILRFFSEFQIL